MTQALSTTILPSESSNMTTEHRSRGVQFGNGYRQDVVDGINSKVETWNLVYEDISETDKNTLITTLDLAGSWDVITWTAPGGVEKKYKMSKEGYQVDRVALIYTVRFKMVQVF